MFANAFSLDMNDLLAHDMMTTLSLNTFTKYRNCLKLSPSTVAMSPFLNNRWLSLVFPVFPLQHHADVSPFVLEFLKGQ